jgi:hypothetical protein
VDAPAAARAAHLTPDRSHQSAEAEALQEYG